MFKSNHKKGGAEIEFKISGMHCPSCAMNIDGALEDLKGIIESTTNYAKQVTKVIYNPDLISPEKISAEIKTVGYAVNQ